MENHPTLKFYEESLQNFEVKYQPRSLKDAVVMSFFFGGLLTFPFLIYATLKKKDLVFGGDNWIKLEDV